MSKLKLFWLFFTNFFATILGLFICSDEPPAFVAYFMGLLNGSAWIAWLVIFLKRDELS